MVLTVILQLLAVSGRVRAAAGAVGVGVVTRPVWGAVGWVGGGVRGRASGRAGGCTWRVWEGRTGVPPHPGDEHGWFKARVLCCCQKPSPVLGGRRIAPG